MDVDSQALLLQMQAAVTHQDEKPQLSGLQRLLAERWPGVQIDRIEAMGPDTVDTVDDVVAGGPDFTRDPTHKAAGYGVAYRVELRLPGEGRRTLVLRTAKSDEFGHDRRSDRAAEVLLHYDTFDRIPDHATPLDVGAIMNDGRLHSLAQAGELYLLTEYVEGVPYAQDLRASARAGEARPLDLERVDVLARYLARLHRRQPNPVAYRRAVRDLVGSGEGIFGMVDSYPPNTPGAPITRLREIERRCVEWRAALSGREHRLARIHGDFHPFNVVFRQGTQFSLLDTCRGSLGDPADDVSCMAINYLFFALQTPGSWPKVFSPLWQRFFGTYLFQTGDEEMLETIAPYLAWRGLVLANPRFYPGLSMQAREHLVSLVERTLRHREFKPEQVESPE
jgi:aminoglycoside phosphotransferase (APT) family kinase protein